MKRSLLLSIFTWLLFVSCNDGIDAELLEKVPKISIDQGFSNLIAHTNETILVDIEMSAPNKLKTLEVYKDGQLIDKFFLEPVSRLNTEYAYTTQVNDVNTEVVLSFIVTDQSDLVDNVDLSIFIQPTTLDFTESSVTLHHPSSGNTYYWDIVKNQMGNLIEADMLVEADSGEWVAGFTAHTNTTFVKAEYLSSGSFMHLTWEDLYMHFAAGTQVNTICDLSVGDIIIAKIRNTQEFAAIQINAISDKIGDNSETITFSYRKTSEFAGQ